MSSLPSQSLVFSFYTEWSRLEATLERNANLVSHAREKFDAGEGRPDDMVRLYDVTIQVSIILSLTLGNSD